MLAVRRARLLSPRPFGLTILGAVVAVAALVIDDVNGAGCGWPPLLLYLAAGVALASVPVRLPGNAISLLPAALLPAWLSCGLTVSSALAVSAVLLAGVVLRKGLLIAVLGAALGLAGVFVGDLAGWAALTTVPPLLGTVPILAGVPASAVASVAFMVGVW